MESQIARMMDANPGLGYLQARAALRLREEVARRLRHTAPVWSRPA